MSAWLSPENRKKIFNSSVSTDGDLSIFEPSNNHLKRYFLVAKFLSYYFFQSAVSCPFTCVFQVFKVSVLLHHVYNYITYMFTMLVKHFQASQNFQMSPYYVTDTAV